MYVMIDNFDSFVYNLKAYFEELGREILVKRCDEITLEELEELKPEGIILSPGPKRPWDSPLCGNRKQISGKGSDLRSLSGTSGVGTLRRCGGRKGKTSHAWKGDRDSQLWNRSVCRFAGRI